MLSLQGEGEIQKKLWFRRILKIHLKNGTFKSKSRSNNSVVVVQENSNEGDDGDILTICTNVFSKAENNILL